MKEIKKEHILAAIQEIDKEGIRPGRTSSTYDLIYNGKPYPPKLVISIANRYATGTELDHNTFSGGIGTPAFQLLEKEGFVIIPKTDVVVKTINVKDDFANWFIEHDGIKSSYFSKQFGSKKERLLVELELYEQEYKKNFDSELFVIDSISYKTAIDSIKKNIYAKTTEFSNFSKKLSSDRPRAILGSNNYLEFLQERFGQDYYINNEIQKQSNFKDKESKFDNMANHKTSLNQILYGPPGTGKTYNTINKAISIVNPNFDLLQDRDVIKAEYDRLVKVGQIVFTTFHQSMSYEDFIEGIKPETVDNRVLYDVQNGIFKEICNSAKAINSIQNFDEVYHQFIEKIQESKNDNLELKTMTGKSFWIGVNSKGNLDLFTTVNKNHQGVLTKQKIKAYANGLNTFLGWESYASAIVTYLKTEFKLNLDISSTPENYVIIIDEINRGNVSAIFGELITLIEEDKRLGRKEGLEVVLPYSKDRFGVPANLYIIGTMNTADRSIEALDTALRRRFSFSEMIPKPELVAEIKFQGFNLAEVLTTINERIEVLLDRDHAIGHSYFLKVKSGDTIALKAVFKNNILPLLQEYFYHDYEKIALILGEGFIRINELKNLQFASFKNIETPEINMQFEVISDINNIETAVQSLLNRNAQSN